MNHLRGLILCFFVLPILSINGEENREAVSIGIYKSRINGTRLISQNTYQTWSVSKKTTHDCVVGYQRDTETGVVFIPVIKLPTLENSTYVVKYSKGVIRVTDKETSKEIVAFHLNSLAPTLIDLDFDEGAYIKSTRTRMEYAE